ANPTINSRPKNGSGTKKVEKECPITSNTVSPANMLPNNRKDNDTTLVTSLTNSSKPTNSKIGFKLNHIARYPFNPSSIIEIAWAERTENSAKAKVVFKSLMGALNIGVK